VDDFTHYIPLSVHSGDTERDFLRGKGEHSMQLHRDLPTERAAVRCHSSKVRLFYEIMDALGREERLTTTIILPDYFGNGGCLLRYRPDLSRVQLHIKAISGELLIDFNQRAEITLRPLSATSLD
jgi:hypothetical protein